MIVLKLKEGRFLYAMQVVKLRAYPMDSNTKT